MKRQLLFLIPSVTLCGMVLGTVPGSMWGQDPDGPRERSADSFDLLEDESVNPSADGVIKEFPYGGAPVRVPSSWESGLVPASAVAADPQENKERETWFQLRKQILSSNDDTERQQLKKKLEDLLGKMLDRDLERRERDLKELENRVAKLRASLDRRKASRDRIMQVQIDSVMLAAEGLAFPFGSPEFSDSPKSFQFFTGTSRPRPRSSRVPIHPQVAPPRPSATEPGSNLFTEEFPNATEPDSDPFSEGIPNNVQRPLPR